MEQIDKLAMDAVKEAIKKLREAGQRPYERNVPPEALRILMAKSRHRITQSDAVKKVGQAIERLRARKELKAPTAPQDWTVIEHQPPKSE